MKVYKEMEQVYDIWKKIRWALVIILFTLVALWLIGYELEQADARWQKQIDELKLEHAAELELALDAQAEELEGVYETARVLSGRTQYYRGLYDMCVVFILKDPAKCSRAGNQIASGPNDPYYSESPGFVFNPIDVDKVQ